MGSGTTLRNLMPISIPAVSAAALTRAILALHLLSNELNNEGLAHCKSSLFIWSDTLNCLVRQFEVTPRGGTADGVRYKGTPLELTTEGCIY